MRKQSARRPAIDLRRTLWVLLFFNIVAGAFFSRVTAPTLLRVVGATTADRQMLTVACQQLADYSWTLAPARQVESKLLLSDHIRTASIRLNLFGRGVLEIANRSPVATVANQTQTLLAEDGSLFRSSQIDDRLPIVSLPASVFGVNSALCLMPSLGRVAVLCRELQDSFNSVTWKVEVDSLGMINLSPYGLAKIFMGSSDDLDKKLEVLRKIFEDRAEVLARSSAVVLTSPGNPTFVPKERRN